MQRIREKKIVFPGRVNPWLLGLGAFFLCILAVNVWMIHLGQETFPGVTTENHYEKGLAFDETLKQRRMPREMGVTVSLDDVTLVTGQKGTLRLRLAKKEGVGMSGMRIDGELYRSVRAGVDQKLSFVGTDDGVYKAEVTPPLPGLWELKLRIHTAMGIWEYDQPLVVVQQSAGRTDDDVR
ncbi:MAG: FixH family protein [Magnetococcales bacterium]|nr:FixH family protein [Magnetococcales bacterium]